jgi:hypothetical protein
MFGYARPQLIYRDACLRVFGLPPILLSVVVPLRWMTLFVLDDTFCVVAIATKVGRAFLSPSSGTLMKIEAINAHPRL